MSKHTPGPWHSCINASHTAYLIKDKAGRLIAMPSWHSSDDTHFPLKDQSEANARLMAAAPELLEALILLEKEMVLSGNAESVDYGWKPAIEKTRAAIAKATGAQS